MLVRLKPGILDVQGAAVKRALGGLGFTDVADLRVGKVIELDVDAANAAAADVLATGEFSALVAAIEDVGREPVTRPPRV